MRLVTWIVAAAPLILAAACFGGGGGGSTPTPNPTPTPIPRDGVAICVDEVDLSNEVVEIALANIRSAVANLVTKHAFLRGDPSVPVDHGCPAEPVALNPELSRLRGYRVEQPGYHQLRVFLVRDAMLEGFKSGTNDYRITAEEWFVEGDAGGTVTDGLYLSASETCDATLLEGMLEFALHLTLDYPLANNSTPYDDGPVGLGLTPTPVPTPSSAPTPCY